MKQRTKQTSEDRKMNKFQLIAALVATCAGLIGAYLLTSHMGQPTTSSIQTRQDEWTVRRDLNARNLISPGCICPASKLNAFSRDEVLAAKQIRSDWSRDLESVLERELDLAGKPIIRRGDVDIPYGYRRFDMLGPITPHCKKFDSFGQGDEEKRACGLLGLLKQQQRDCTIISLGGHNQWSFEEAVFAALPGCIIHTFDCTVKDSARPPAAIASRTFLHRACIGETDATAADGKVLLSLSLSSLRPSPSLPFYLRPSLPPSLSFSLPPPLHSRV
jgi:hypothetical protein